MLSGVDDDDVLLADELKSGVSRVLSAVDGDGEPLTDERLG